MGSTITALVVLGFLALSIWILMVVHKKHNKADAAKQAEKNQ